MRINPRRPSNVSPTGLKRIVLTAPATASTHDSVKPLRLLKNPSKGMLVIAHSNNGVLEDHARQAIAAAAILADDTTEVLAIILGELNESLADMGADKVIHLPELTIEKFQPEVELSHLIALIESIKPVHILMPDNFVDGDLGRRLIAQQTTKTATTQVVEIDLNHIASYHAGGSLLAKSALPDIILLAANAVDSHLPFVSTAKLMDAPISLVPQSNAYQDLGLQTVAAKEIALEEADLIVSAGNGVQNLATFESLAHALEASIGASRVAVDAGKFSRDKQIGASGKTVSASAYLAIGISGAVQHLQGIKDCRHVIAINTDASAAIIKRANLSVIGDAEEIMQALITLIAAEKLEKLQVAA